MTQRLKRKSSTNLSNLTQQTLEAPFFEARVNFVDTVNNVVRYMVTRSGEHSNFGKVELIRNVIHKSSGSFDEIMTKVTEILKNTYGYNLLWSQTAKGKENVFIVSNALPYIQDPFDDAEIPEDTFKILLLLILTHIFMSAQSTSDVSLFEFLRNVGIDVEVMHPVFGNVKDYILKTLTKKNYLASTVDPISKRYTFTWGTRSEKEISKQAILEFVCKVYQHNQPKDWTNQYQIASEQDFRNNPEVKGNMEVE